MEKRKTKADSPDMSWKFEACIVAIGALVLAAFLAVVMLREAEAGPAPVSHFIQADYEVFDRNFKISGKSSPLESEIQRGEILPDYIPALGAEFRVIVATSLKDEHLRMFRYGQTLVLLEPRTRRVEDILDLTAPDFMSAQNGPTQPKV